MTDDATQEKSDTGPTTLDLDQLANTLRGRVDLFGKALAAIATLGTGAVGLSKVSDMAPWQAGEGKWVAVALICLLAAAVAGIVVAVRLMNVNVPQVVEPSVDPNSLGSAAADVRTIFSESAQRYGFTTLLALQEHATSLRRAAARAASADQQERRNARAAEAEAEIERALSRARLAVVRRSSTEAMTGRTAWACYLVVIVGLGGFALAADAVTSDPAARIATAKSCAEARSAGAQPTELPTDCATTTSPATPSAAPTTLTPAQQRAQLVAALSDALTSCEKVAAASPSATPGGAVGPTDCAAIKSALRVLLGP